ncbi:DUF2069 domain-containing protein [Zooshikella marina]|uniref:DUF2069 domain-containing protein n=1 Tax=Zooshikella ganghwensis TaxID=202772 RepID=UPI001BAF2442|nr:DUF2069 domain-containing protein [Zooshikella ganghwensis]MBU2704710.1 DUF2069 domain-containing protein [Zooshikella ganghwensis]
MSSANVTAIKHHSMSIVTKALYITLILYLILDTWLLRPPEGVSLVVITLVKLLPLSLLFPGVFHGKPRTYAWLCFILTIYFTAGVLATWQTPEQWQNWFLTLTSSTMFITSMLYIRWFYRVH